MGQNTSGCFAKNGGMSCADSHEELYRDCHGDLFPRFQHRVETLQRFKTEKSPLSCPCIPRTLGPKVGTIKP